MPLYDVYCVDCKIIEEDIWLKVNEDVPSCKCGGIRYRICNCHSFKLRYNPKIDTVGWSHDGYASSQYWKDVKAARDRGERVKGADEN
jgi:hypothetical protein